MTSKIMLQKIVNGIAIASGIVSLAVVGTVGYVYVRKDAIIEDVKGKVMEQILPNLPIPEMPTVTGGALALPSPSSGLPKF
tara:strand:- start:614 stop:856 length:243 start_codon:yes stop_codon:yes gene_type:complete